MRIRLSGIIIFFMAVAQLQAQTGNKALVLSLEEAMGFLLQNSVQAAVNNRLKEIDRQRYKIYRSTLLPQLGFNGNWPGYTNQISSVVQPDGTIRFTEVKQGLANAGLTLKQAIPYTGGVINVSSGLNRFTWHNAAGEFVNWQSQPVLISISQPILTFNQSRLDGRIAKLNLELSGRSFVENRESLCLELVQVFFETLLAQQRVHLNYYNWRMADTLYTFANDKFRLGRMNEEELLQIKLRTIASKTDLSWAEASLNSNLDKLRTLLNLSQEQDIELIDNKEIPELTINAGEAVRYMLQNNPDVVRMKLEQLQQSALLEKAEKERLPDITLNASYGYNKSSLAIEKVYKDPSKQQSITLGFYLPLMTSGANNAACKIARYELENQLNRQEIKTQIAAQEIANTIMKMDQARQSLIAIRSMREVLDRRYEIILAKFLSGKNAYSDVLLAQSESQTAKLNFVSSQRDFWTAYYSLRAQTLFDFERSEPLYIRGE